MKRGRHFMLLDFGLREFGVKDSEERLKHYRRYVYEAGVINRPDKPSSGLIDNSLSEKERKDNFELKRVQIFRYRTHYKRLWGHPITLLSREN